MTSFCPTLVYQAVIKYFYKPTFVLFWNELTGYRMEA